MQRSKRSKCGMGISGKKRQRRKHRNEDEKRNKIMNKKNW